jgi:hypothetical protein
MDSQDKDESKIRRRDETLARRVGEALDQLRPRGEEACPDAEVLAAYAEQSLDAAESARWEGHFAACTRCRSVLRVLAVSADTPLAEKEIARLGELVATTPAPGPAARPAEHPRSWLADWRMRWLAPALGVTTVLAVWFAMRPPWRGTNRGASETLIAQTPREELRPSPAPLEAVGPSRESLPRDQKSESTPQAKKKSGPSRQEQKSISGAPPENAPTGASTGIGDKNNENQISAQAQAKVQPLAPLSTPAASGAPGSSAMADAAAPRAPAPGPAAPPSTSQTVTVTEAAPVVETTTGTLASALEPGTRTDLPVNGRNFESLARLKAAPGNAILLKAPSGSVLWRAGVGGSIERSADGGKTWVAQTSPSRQDWLAGSVFSDQGCWLAGRKGAIARTVDGEHWEQILSPGLAAGANAAPPDWVGITSFNALSTTVTAADGRKFVTSDGGMTWQRQ